MSLLHDMKDAIQTAEPIKAELDRGLRILLPTQASKRVLLSIILVIHRVDIYGRNSILLIN